MFKGRYKTRLNNIKLYVKTHGTKNFISDMMGSFFGGNEPKDEKDWETIGDRARLIKEIDEGAREATDIESHIMKMITKYDRAVDAFAAADVYFEELLAMINEFESIAPSLWKRSKVLRDYADKEIEPIINDIIPPIDDASALFDELETALDHLSVEVTSGKKYINNLPRPAKSVDIDMLDGTVYWPD